MKEMDFRYIATQLKHLNLRRAITLAALIVSLSTTAADCAVNMQAGLQLLSFRDAALSDVYDSPIGPTFRANLLQLKDWQVGAEVSYFSASDSPETLPFIERSELSMRFIPIRLEVTSSRPLGRGFSITAGGAGAMAFIKETLTVTAAHGAIDSEKTESDAWLGFGLLLGIDRDIGRWGTIGMGYEMFWASARRPLIPGNSHQIDEMTGGWQGATIYWGLPW
jgi:hypothetical protein